MTMKPASLDIDPLDRALAILTDTDNADDAPNLARLAALVGLSPGHLQRAFRKRFGATPSRYARDLDLNRK